MQEEKQEDISSESNTNVQHNYTNAPADGTVKLFYYKYYCYF